MQHGKESRLASLAHRRLVIPGHPEHQAVAGLDGQAMEALPQHAQGHGHVQPREGCAKAGADGIESIHVVGHPFKNGSRPSW
jgi:hypothetical protein